VIFVDTGAWYAIEVEDDSNHASARRFLVELSKGRHGVPITTDYVLDEAMTLLRGRRGLQASLSFIDKVTSSKSVKIAWMDEGLFSRSLEEFRKSKNREWSFTDCASFALMKELSITEAFSFDKHFREAGFSVLP
jgi:predicted nucleic acid-binding protein